MIKFFKKFKKPYFGPILGPFGPNLGKNEFFLKKGSCQFLDIPIIYHHAKNWKNYWVISYKMANWRTDRWTERQVIL